VLRLRLLPCLVPFAPEDKLRCPPQGALAQPHCLVSPFTAIPKWHHVPQCLADTERLLLHISGRIWISVMLRSQTLIDLYPGLFAKTFDSSTNLLVWVGFFSASCCVLLVEFTISQEQLLPRVRIACVVN